MDGDLKRSHYLVPISAELLAGPPLDLVALFAREAPARKPRPVMQAALLFTALRRCAEADHPLAAQVLQLHRPPTELDAWAECQGCGAGGYDDGVTWEACPTVALLADRYQLTLP